jgi:DivIVA domain-containing protein
MALTPEDVVNKRFQPTKFREGYDQDEVDDFLDEVVVELRRLNQENEELRQRLMAADSRVNELQRTAAQPAPALDQPITASAPAPAAPAPFQPAPVAQVDPNADPGNTNNLLQLARRLHEEHVREGVEKRDALIAEGQAQAARTIDEAQAQAAHAIEESKAQAARVLEDGRAQANRAIEEAQAQTRSQLSALDHERTVLEARVEELRNFEREYRAKLKGYIEGQLRELESSTSSNASVPSAPAPALVGAGAPVIASAPELAASPNYPAQQIAPPPANYPGFAGN